MAILAAVAIAAQVLGKVAETNAAVGQHNTQAKMSDRNAQILEQRGLQIGADAARNEEALRRDYRDFAGTQLAAAAESGLGTGGSILDVIRQSESRANLDALNIRYRGQTEAQGFRAEAGTERVTSSLARQMASKAKAAGALGIIGTAAGGGYEVRRIYKQNGNSWW